MEKRSADQARFAEQRIVRGQNDPVVTNPVSIGLRPLLLRIEFRHGGVFKNADTIAVNLLGEREEKFERMKFCLVGEAHALEYS